MKALNNKETKMFFFGFLGRTSYLRKAKNSLIYNCFLNGRSSSILDKSEYWALIEQWMPNWDCCATLGILLGSDMKVSKYLYTIISLFIQISGIFQRAYFQIYNGSFNFITTIFLPLSQENFKNGPNPLEYINTIFFT